MLAHKITCKALYLLFGLPTHSEYVKIVTLLHYIGDLMRFVPYVFFLLACRSEEGVKIYNSTPVVVITSHTNDAVLLEGVEYSFLGQVSDTNNTHDELQITWKSNTQELCTVGSPNINGETICQATLNESDTQITLQATAQEICQSA